MAKKKQKKKLVEIYISDSDFEMMIEARDQASGDTYTKDVGYHLKWDPEAAEIVSLDISGTYEDYFRNQII